MSWHPTFAMAALCAAAINSFVPAATGETIAEDTASDPAYAEAAGGAWLGTNPSNGENPAGDDNGGYGFLPWNFSRGYHLPQLSPYGNLNHFIDGVDFDASEFNDLGSPSFALTNAQSEQGITARALRPFAEPLDVGDIFSLRFDSPEVLDPFGPFGSPSVNILFQGSDGSTTFDIGSGVYGTGPTQDVFPWRVKDASGSFNTGISPFDTSDGSALSIEVTSETTGSLTFDGQTFEVAFSNGPPAAVLFQLYQNSSGDGGIPPNGDTTGEREFYFNDLKIESPEVVLSGDYNGDGMVDAADYTVWRDNLGSTIELPNDSTSGDVGVDDYDAWKANFGAGSDAATAAAESTGVPEPSTQWPLLMAGLAGFLLHSCAQCRGQGRTPAVSNWSRTGY